jgi:Uma2 family endonuclease
MVAHSKTMTAEEFDAFTLLPENAERLFEFIGGEIVEVPSNPYSSELASNISFYLKLFLRDKNIPGHVTGEGGGYRVSGERYAPDVAYVAKARQDQLAREGYNPIAPDLAVEVASPTDSEKQRRIKIANYLAAGTLVWMVFPDEKLVEVYAPGQPAKVLDVNGVMDGGNVLPGFQLAVKDIFAE